MQRVLCRVAQSQGNFTTKNTKLQLPSCTWYFIKNAMAVGGVDSVSTVKYSQPQAVLSWGLVYHSRRRTGHLDVLRFDTAKKLDVFRGLFGSMAGYGVRKQRPKYSDAPFLLSLNAVVNAVCPLEGNEADDDKSDYSACSVFQRFGVTEDGIDLAYDSLEGTLQILLRYRKLVVSNVSLHLLIGVGVVSDAGGQPLSSANEGISNIAPGMEFMDGKFVMRIQEVQSSAGEIHATKFYKILDNAVMTKKVDALEIVVYRDVKAVHRKIQEMLE
jgi:hypothetical protein